MMVRVKIFFIIILFFSMFNLYSFEPENYIVQELYNLEQENSFIFYYDWGNSAKENLSKSEFENNTPTSCIVLMAWSVYNNLKKDGFYSVEGKPRNIAEAKLLAEVCWDISEYELITQGIIMREKKY